MGNLERYLEAQIGTYELALSEIKAGKKRSHWMWYIFPQIEGLGYSKRSKFYAIKHLAGAEAYVTHPILGARLIEICKALLELSINDAEVIFGSPDDLKLKSCMTLFSLTSNSNPIFRSVLNKFFGGEMDKKTILLLSTSSNQPFYLNN